MLVERSLSTSSENLRKSEEGSLGNEASGGSVDANAVLEVTRGEDEMRALPGVDSE